MVKQNSKRTGRGYDQVCLSNSPLTVFYSDYEDHVWALSWLWEYEA